MNTVFISKRSTICKIYENTVTVNGDLTNTVIHIRRLKCDASCGEKTKRQKKARKIILFSRRGEHSARESNQLPQ